MATSSDPDAMLDTALEDTFPASDPPANTVVTGLASGSASRPAAIAAPNRRAQGSGRVSSGPSSPRATRPAGDGDDVG
jgi:hypothetical protein